MKLRVLTILGIVFAIICSTPIQAQHGTASERISRTRFFNHQIQPVPFGANEAEAEQLWPLLHRLATSNYQDGLIELDEWLQANPTSPWAPSLDAALGHYYFKIGRYTLAMGHLELAWVATKHYETGSGKQVADSALANWSRLLASLGRYETLTALVTENHHRVLDRGPLSQIWERVREATADMRRNPGGSYQCGTFALSSVASSLRLNYDKRSLLGVPSPTNGFSMKVLAELSQQLGLGLVPALREAGEEILVPSVVHWEQDHYAAIIGRRGNLYKVVDPTFGSPRYMTAETINAEASGAFMIRSEALLPGWRWLGAGETQHIFGRGNPSWINDPSDQKCSCETGACKAGGNGNGNGNSGGRGGGNEMRSNSGASSCGSCTGMVTWRISEPYINLWLEDEPFSYQPALGKEISLRMLYKQRDEVSFYPYDGQHPFGYGWNTPWLSFVENDDRYVINTLHHGEGGSDSYDFENGNTAQSYYNNSLMEVIKNGLGAEQHFFCKSIFDGVAGI